IVPTGTVAKIDDLTVNDATLDVPAQDDIGLNPVKNATYRIYDGANPIPIATVSVDQTFPSSAITDGQTDFDPLETVTISSGVLRVELDNKAGDVASEKPQHIIAGPVRIQSVSDAQVAQRVQILRNVETLAISPSGYSEQGSNWQDLRFVAGGTGNFPVWESALLRPAFRALFKDWQNGVLQVPSLGDAPPRDLNQVLLLADFTSPDLTTPFNIPPVVAPVGLNLLANGPVDSESFGADVIITSITGDGLAGLDSLT